MAEISASIVKALRDKTGAGMMDCKKALKETDCDMDAAVKYLREKGIAKAASKSDRAANQGVVATCVSSCKRKGVIGMINCETDFAAKGEKFQTLVADVLKQLKASSATTLEEALAVPMAESNVEDYIKAMCSVIGENMILSQYQRYEVPAGSNGTIASYIHMGGKIGVLLEVTTGKPETLESEAAQTLIKDLTLHIAAAAPRSVDSSSLDPAFIAEEQDIARAQLLAEGKPEALLEKILPGKLKALYAQSCLVNQAFVKDPNVTIEQLVADTAKQLGDSINIVAFSRFQLGA